MKLGYKSFFAFLSEIILIIILIITASAHPGRTDSNGGHRDNKNQSGLGEYHYHCGGYPANLHSVEGCPYINADKQDTVKSSAGVKGGVVNDSLGKSNGSLTQIITVGSVIILSTAMMVFLNRKK